jgi:hypothetical protein
MVVDKWYLDAVFPDGTIWIGYRASLRLWKCPPLFWTCGTLISPDGKERRITRWKKMAAPRFEGNHWHWQGPDGFQGRWEAFAPGFDTELAAEGQCKVRWNCIVPKATVTRVSEDAKMTNADGTGYIEHLQIEVSKAGLPFRELWWGRAHAGPSSLVWIRWSRGRDLTLLVENGAPVNGRLESLGDGRVRAHTPSGEWETGTRGTLCDRNLRRSFPRLLVWLTGGLAPVREQKMCGPVRHRNAVGEFNGTGIWEEVEWL